MLNFALWLEQDSIEEQLENCKNIEEIKNVLDQNKVNYFFPKTIVPILVFDFAGISFIIDDFSYPSIQKSKDWIYEVSWKSKLNDYVKEPDFNLDFWRSVAPRDFLYHGTTKENLLSILSKGLMPKCKTRGISNRSTGCAIFTSKSLDSTKYHYENIVQINVSQMKKDGFMPQVNQEEPIENAEMLSSLAHLIGLEDFEPEIESGLEYDTVIFWEFIPPKYLSEL